MAQVVRKTYALSDFATNLSYGLAGARKVEYCSNHILGGMVGIVSRRISQPSYCVSDIRNVKYCAQHAAEYTVYDPYRKCIYTYYTNQRQKVGALYTT